MQQIILDFGTREVFGLEIPLRVYGYGLMLVVGFLVSIYFAQWRARRVGENPEHVAHCGLLALIGGILGARIAYVVQHHREMFRGPADPVAVVLDITSGGLIYYGGVILATVMVLGYLFAKRLPVRRHLDVVAASLMLGLAFGRAGCTLNGCCYGAQCRHDWALGIRFPMCSKPLIKFDGRDNPFSEDTEGPSEIYRRQLDPALPPEQRVRPPEALINQCARDRIKRAGGSFLPVVQLHPPQHLHGALSTDQTVMWADANGIGEAREAFEKLAGSDGRLGPEEWRLGVGRGKGLLRGSEHWDEAVCFAMAPDRGLTFQEAYAYLADRRRRFDADGDGKLSPAERAAANRNLQVDQFELAAAAWSLPVKPAQPLGLINALLLAVLLAVFFRWRRREGQVFALLVILYPITRFALEAVRDDNAHDLLEGVLTHNQYTSLALTAIGVIMWLILRRMPASAGPSAAERQAVSVPRGRKPR